MSSISAYRYTISAYPQQKMASHQDHQDSGSSAMEYPPAYAQSRQAFPPVSVVVASRTNQRTVSARRPRNASVPFVPACIVFAFELHHESSTPPAGRRHADRPTITSYSLVRIDKKVLDNRSRDSIYCIFCRYINLEIRRTFGKRAPFPASLPGSNDKNSHM
jgi:hypothetical protein